MKNLLLSLMLAGIVGAAAVSAHVVVKPASVNVAAIQTFTISVPNEKAVAITGLRLTVPDGLKEVSPTVKPGWTVSTRKVADTIVEITWTTGSIPPEQRDDFTFSAQAPATAGTLQWKAYQTYADGSMVSWDKDPATIAGDDAVGASGPYSTTTVIDDLAATPATSNGPALGVSIAALILALLGIALPLYRKS
jgi:uncharacterized protein YcnI